MKSYPRVPNGRGQDHSSLLAFLWAQQKANKQESAHTHTQQNVHRIVAGLSRDCP